MKRFFLVCFIIILCVNCSFLQKTSNSSFDRKKYVREYLDFAFGRGSDKSYPKIYQAISNALNEIPEDVLEKVSNPKHPVIFTVNITSGIARWANSSEFNLTVNTERALDNGFYLIKLADELENTSDVESIEGIVLHELSHNYLDHLKREQFSCEMEREANRLVKKWGFEEKFLKAKAMFGSKVQGDSPCRDEVEGQSKE